jgi:CRP/FNR family transcriptional regulator, cyclic AMP receptor protein
MAVANESSRASAPFEVDRYLSNEGPGRKVVHLNKGEIFFSQGDPADCVFYLCRGRVKISVVSRSGKEATIRLVSPRDFFGEKAMEAEPGVRVTQAAAVMDCTALRITRPEFMRVIQEEPAFSYRFSSFLLTCTLKTQADLVDQLFNRAEKRLARLLLMLAESTRGGEEDALILPISQEALANMIGSTRPRVNAFMNRFRKLGYIEYDDRIRVHKSLLNVFLRD